jgi:hypothetical protein
VRWNADSGGVLCDDVHDWCLDLGDAGMTFTDKDFEDAMRLRRVTELAKPIVSIADGIHLSGSSAGSSYRLTAPPKSVGGYHMGEITFNLTKKPRWIHRMGVRLVLGWKWEDA